MRSYEEYMYDGSLPPSEDDVVEEEVKHVYETLGEEGVKTRSDHALASIEKYKDADAVPGHVVQVWLREFFESRIANYRLQTNQIPQNEYTSRMKEANDKMSVVVANAYEKMLQIDPKTIFKYSLKHSIGAEGTRICARFYYSFCFLSTLRLISSLILPLSFSILVTVFL